MKKYFLCFILIISIVFPFQSFAINENANHLIYIVVNEQFVSFDDTYPVVKNGITYVPIRFLSNYLGVKTKWDYRSNSIFLNKGRKQIILDLSTKSLFTKEGIILTDCLFLEDDRTMAPYKFIANYFGYQVSYIDKGPIARAKNKGAVLEDEELFFSIQNKIIAEKEKILMKIKKKKEEEEEKKRIELKKNSKIAYVTFDDGPTAYTEEILNILKEYECNATFFMLSNRISNNKTIVEKVINEGNTVGLHGVTHDVNKIYKSVNTIVSEMDTCNNTLENAVGVKSNLIRVPYGSKPYMSKKQKNAIEKAGYKMWDWNVDSKDSNGKYVPPKIIIENVKNQIKTKKVPVILLHERGCTVKALPYILKYLKENGYNVIPIHKNDEPMNFWNNRNLNKKC